MHSTLTTLSPPGQTIKSFYPLYNLTSLPWRLWETSLVDYNLAHLESQDTEHHASAFPLHQTCWKYSYIEPGWLKLLNGEWWAILPTLNHLCLVQTLTFSLCILTCDKLEESGISKAARALTDSLFTCTNRVNLHCSHYSLALSLDFCTVSSSKKKTLHPLSL